LRSLHPQALLKANELLSAESRMLFRIGINVRDYSALPSVIFEVLLRVRLCQATKVPLSPVFQIRASVAVSENRTSGRSRRPKTCRHGGSDSYKLFRFLRSFFVQCSNNRPGDALTIVSTPFFGPVSENFA
jgi:hypothetical protein